MVTRGLAKRTKLKRLRADPLPLLTKAGLPLESGRLRQMLKEAEALACAFRARRREAMSSIIAKVIVEPQTVSIELSLSVLCDALGIGTAAASPEPVHPTVPVRLTRSGRAVRLIQRDGRTVTAGSPDPGLVELLRKGRAWWLQLQTGTID